MDWKDFVPGGKKYDPAPEKPKGTVPDIPKPPPPPADEWSPSFIQIGNCIVRPEKVQAISFDPDKHEISIALECGETWFYQISTSEARFNAIIEQVKTIFNIDIKEP